MASVITHNPVRPLPLSRKASPFKDPRPAPCTPAKTAKAWDEYEKQARQNARRRDRASQSSQPQRNSASSDVGKGSRSSSSTARSSYDFKFRTAPIVTSTAVATCKSCKQPITYSSGICERCKKTIILPIRSGESTPPLSPAARNFASTDLHLLEKTASQEEPTSRLSSSPKRKGCPPALQLTNPPIRLDSLRPPPNTQDIMEANRSRKASLTDPNEPFLRLQYAHQYVPATYSIPTTPTYPLTSPPSTIPSRVSTRPSSFAQMTSSLTQNAIMPSYTRQNSATPSELSHLQHYAPLAPTSPPSLHQVNTGLHNTTSAWDDWDSDGEEKVRLVGYWKRSGKDKSTTHASTANLKGKERERADSKVSYSSNEERRSSEKKHEKRSKSSIDRKSEKKQSKESSRSQSRMSTKSSEPKASSQERESYNKHKKRPSGFIRAISCGC